MDSQSPASRGDKSAIKSHSNLGSFVHGKWHCACPESPEAIYYIAGAGSKNAGKGFWRCYKNRDKCCKFFLLEEGEELRKALILEIRGEGSHSVSEGKEGDSQASTLDFKGRNLDDDEDLYPVSPARQATVSSGLDVVPRQFRLFWACSCGFRDTDTFLEYREGAMEEFAQSLENAGVTVSLEPLGLSDPVVDTIKMLLLNIAIFFTNIFTDLYKLFLGRASLDQVDSSQKNVKQKPGGNTHTTASSQNKSLGTLAVKTAQPVSSSSKQQIGQSSSGSTQLQSAPTGPIGATTESNHGNADYLLLCIDDSQDLTTRDDLDLTTRNDETGQIPVISDQQLFSLFRARYFSRRNWIHRYLSLKSLQTITFVKFTLLENQEVDGFQPDQLPFPNAHHYQFLPRQPGLVPPFSSRFLRHRFKSPGFCCDSTICLEQIPKRIERRPDRGRAPDMYVGWGLYLQDGFSSRRIGFWGLLGMIVSLGVGIICSARVEAFQTYLLSSAVFWLLNLVYLLISSVCLG